MKKKVLSMLLAVIMLVGIIPLGAISASAAETVDCTHNLVSVQSMTHNLNENIAHEGCKQLSWGEFTSPDGNPAYNVTFCYKGGNVTEEITLAVNNITGAEYSLPVSWCRYVNHRQNGKYIYRFYVDDVLVQTFDYTTSDSDWSGWRTDNFTIPTGSHTLKFSVQKTDDGGWAGGCSHAIEVPYMSAFVDGVCSICNYKCPHNEFYQTFDTEQHWLVCEDEDGCKIEIPNSRAAHTYDENSNCTGCAYSRLNVVTVDNIDYYEIGNAQQLLSFVNLINVGHKTTINAKLTADINMLGITSFKPIGLEQFPYEGIFDGQGHRILNLNLNKPDTDYVGLFGVVRGITVRNIVIDKSCSFVGKNASPFGYVGGSGDYRFERCGNEANVTAVNSATGIFGGYGSPTYISCYSTGTVSSEGNTAGGLMDLITWTTLKGCYFAGEVYKGGVKQNPALYSKFNHYEDGGDWPAYNASHSFSPNDPVLTNGTLLNQLNSETGDFIQGATHPILFAEPEEITDAAQHEHNYIVTYEWNEDLSECKAIAVCADAGCKVDGNYIEETATAQSSFSGKLEGSSIGTFTYTAEFVNPIFATQQKNKNISLSETLTELYITNIKVDSFDLSWDWDATAESYIVDIATNDQFMNCIEGYSGLSTTDNNLHVTGLKYNKTYYCRVRSVDASGLPSAAVTNSAKTTGTMPDVTVEDNRYNIVLSNGDATVSNISIAYIGETEQEFDDLSTLKEAGKEYPEINGTSGLKSYNNPADGKKFAQFNTGYYAVYVKYTVTGREYALYKTLYIIEPTLPEITASAHNITLDYNDFTVNRLSLAYIGESDKDINDWGALETAGKQFIDINGTIGCKHYDYPADGKKIAEYNTGYYAAYIRYDVNGENKTRYQTVYIEEPTFPQTSVDKGNIVLEHNSFPVTRMSIAYIGTEAKEIGDWGAFETAGKAFTDINGTIGCKHYDNPADGKKVPEFDTGYYAVYIRYDVNGVAQTKYQVLYLTAPVFPEVTVTDNHIVLNHNDCVVTRMSIAYIGTAEKTIEDWGAFETAGKQFIDINGTIGCKHYDYPADGKSIAEYDSGYYAVYMRYTVNGATRTKYQVVNLTAPVLPEVTISNNHIVLNHNDCVVTRMSIAYIGTAEKTIEDWGAFETAGKQFIDINGTIGCKHYDNPISGKSIAEYDSGYYAVYMRYTVNGDTNVKYQVVNLTAPVLPEVTISNNHIVLNSNECNVTRLSVAYIGTEEKTIKDWGALENAGKAFTEINGTIGCKHYDNPISGKSIAEYDSGYYAVYMRYTVNGDTNVKYQVVKLTAPVLPEVTVNDNHIVLNSNECNVTRLSVAYIGTEEKTIKDWGALETAGKQFIGINGTIGCKHYDNPADGKAVAEYDSGYYAVYMRYTVNGDTNAKYQVVYLTASALPEINAENGNIILNSRENTVSCISIAYIGEAEKAINTWAEFTEAGLAYPDLNSSYGYLNYNDPADGIVATEYNTGYYAVCVRSVIDGEEVVRYRVIYVEGASMDDLPYTEADETYVRLFFNKYNVTRIDIAYVGTEEKNIGCWNAFETNGKQYTDINGEKGYTQWELPPNGMYIRTSTPGYYAAAIRYEDDGEIKTVYRMVLIEE